jgi:hypothetical protein
METFIKIEVGVPRPRYQHFIHVVEHLASGLLQEDSNTVVLEVDLDGGFLSFQAGTT